MINTCSCLNIYSVVYYLCYMKKRLGVTVPLPSSLMKEGDAQMTILEVLTLLLVVFAALSYIDNHKKK